MAKHIVKCAVCKCAFNTNEIQAVKHGTTRYSHATCEPDNQNFVPLGPTKSQDEKDLEQLRNYTKELLGDSYSSQKVSRQIKKYHSEGMSYSGMFKSLCYFYEVKGNSIEKAEGGIGIVPHVYEQARRYYYGIFMSQSANSQVDVESYTTKEREIVIHQPSASKLDVKLFDLGD